MVLTGSLELSLLAGRPPTKRVWGCGPSALWTRWRGAFWLRVWLPSTTSWICCIPQRTDTWVEEVTWSAVSQDSGEKAAFRRHSLCLATHTLISHPVPLASLGVLVTLDLEPGPRAFRLRDKVSVAQKEYQ